MALIAGPLALWALVIAATDVRQLRVPNSLLLLVLVPALLVQLINGSGVLGIGHADAALGFAAGLGLGLPGYTLRQFGAGDVKYMAVLGLLCGPRGVLAIVLLAALVLGVMAVAAVIRARMTRRPPGRLPAAVALSAGFLLLLVMSGNLIHGF